MKIQRFGTTRRYSDSVVHGNTLYLVEVPGNLEADITEQTANLLASVDTLLAQAGSVRHKLLMVTVYLADMADFPAVNEVYGRYFQGDFPARATVQVAALPRGAQVEIDAVAFKMPFPMGPPGPMAA